MSNPSRSLLFAAALILAGGLSAAWAGPHGHGDHADTTTLTGEVMDLACYLQHPADGQGPDHAKCAQQCINRGLPAGLKVGGQLYLLIGPGHESVVDKIAPLAGKRAVVKGQLINQDGMKVLVVKDVSLAP